MKKREILSGSIPDIFSALVISVLVMASCSDDLDRPSYSGNIGFTITMEQAWNPVQDKMESGNAGKGSTRSQDRVLTLGDDIGGEMLYLHPFITDSIGLLSIGEAKADRRLETRAAPVNTGAMYPSFGVFAYSYTGTWNESLTPDYMYNTEVRKEGTGIWSPSSTYYWPGKDKKIRFFAYAPHNGEGITYAPRDKTGTLSLVYIVPSDVARQSDLVVAASGELVGDARTNVNLTFKHTLTAVKFVAGDDMLGGQIMRITLKGVYGSASYTVGGSSWNDYGTKSDFSQTLEVITDGTPDTEITPVNATFMMIPQNLPEDARIEVIYMDNITSTERTLSTLVSGTEWSIGKTVTYRISTSSILLTPTFTVTEPGEFPYRDGGTHNYSVTSYATVSRDGDPTVTRGLAWDTEFSTDEGATWTKTPPGWLRYFTGSGGGSTETIVYAAGVDNQEIVTITGETHNEKLRRAGPVSDRYDLSTNGGSSSANTANCYLVNAPGSYSLPLVYGNAIKNSVTNGSSYKSSSTETDGKILRTFMNHLGVGITDPYIYNNAGCTPDNCCLVWQDSEGLVSDVRLSVDRQNLEFTVSPATIAQGNAIVAVRDASREIMWSWHIWVTDYKLGEGDKTVTNYTDNKYEVMAVNLGWCETLSEGCFARSCQVRFTQEKTGEQRVITIKQNGLSTLIRGNNVYYQWGRKDPMLPGIYDETTSSLVNKSCYADNAAYTYVMLPSVWGYSTIGGSIQIPYMFLSGEWWWAGTPGLFTNLWSSDNSGTAYYGPSEKVTKTVYDPSPVGYCVPPVKTFTGFVTSDANNSGSEPGNTWNKEYFNVSGSFNKGFRFYCGRDKTGETLFFPATCFRLYNNNSLESNYGGYGLTGFYWYAGPYSQNQGQYLFFADNGTTSNHIYTRSWYYRLGNGASVRAVRE